MGKTLKQAWKWLLTRWHFWVFFGILLSVYSANLIFALSDGLGIGAYFYIVFHFSARLFILLAAYGIAYSYFTKKKK